MGLTMRYPDLYMMRHGQTVWNAEGRMQGRMNSPLTEFGAEQARRQAWRVREVDLPLRYASPTGRAQETARIVFGDKDFLSDDRLQEIDVGDFAGKLEADLRRDHPDIFTGGELDWYDRIPGGEDFVALRARAQSFLDDLPGPALIVTHSITLRMIRLVAMGLPLSRFGDMPVVQGALHVVSDGNHRVEH